MSDLFGKYNLEFLPENLDLNEFLTTVESSDEVASRLEEKLDSIPRSDQVNLLADIINGQSRILTEMPLTPEEADEADARIEELIDGLDKLEKRIQAKKAELDRQLFNVQGTNAEFAVEVNIRGRPRLRRIMRKVFGKRYRSISYSQYSQAYEARRLLEEEQSNEYVAPEVEGE